MDKLFLGLADQYLEALATNPLVRESPKVKQGEKPSTKGKNNIERGEHSLLRSIITCLNFERDHAKAQAEEPAKIVSDMGQLAFMNAARSKLPDGIASSIKRLGSEAARSRSENAQVEESFTTIDRKDDLPSTQNKGKYSDLKGTYEKGKGVKQVVDGEDDKANEGVEAEQCHVASYLETNNERNDSLGATNEKLEPNDKSRSGLEIKRSGAFHGHDNAADAINTIVIAQEEHESRRADVQLIMAELDNFRGT